MPKKSPAFSFYAGDYLSDTQHLTPAEEGAYVRLLATAWKGTGGLPQGYIFGDDERLSRIVKMTPAQWRKARANVLALFTFDDDLSAYFHRRLVEERDRQMERSAMASQSAKRRWVGNANAVRTHCVGNAAREAENESISTVGRNLKAESAQGGVGGSDDLSAYLAVLAELHPRFADEVAVARALFEQRAMLPPLAEFRATLAAWAASAAWLDGGGKYVPKAARWIRDGGYRTPPTKADLATGAQYRGSGKAPSHAVSSATKAALAKLSGKETAA